MWVQGPTSQRTGKHRKMETVGHLVDRSGGDPLQVKLPILCHQHRAYTRQCQHSNSSLTRRNLTAPRYPTEISFTFPRSVAVTLVYYHIYTAAVSQKTRRVPACLRNHCSQPGSRINENILVFAPSASSLQACWSTRHCCAGFAVREDNGYQSHQSTLTRRASYKHLAGFMSLGKSH